MYYGTWVTWTSAIPVIQHFLTTMVEHATAVSPLMRECIGPRVLLGGSFNAIEVLCVNVVTTLFQQHTSCLAGQRTRGGIVRHALLLPRVMKMCGVVTLNSRQAACDQCAYG